MPLLARMTTAPLLVEARRGALADLATILADQRISSAGRVAVVVGATIGPRVRASVGDALAGADWFTVDAGTVDAAVKLVEQCHGRRYDAIVGIGGGTVLDVSKFAAARLGLPMVSVASNLAHDGIASPVSTLDNDAGRGSYGVPAPIAVLVDLDLVGGAPRRSIASGIGEIVSNPSALADWELSREHTGEAVDGFAVALSRTAATAVLHHPGTLADDALLVTLAESLVLSGMAMVAAGTSRPSSGGCHEISHALDLLYPQRAGYHGEQVGLGAAFCWHLRGDGAALTETVGCLHRHGLPFRPTQLGFSADEFARAVAYAPQTRPGRYTVLEELNLDDAAIRRAVTGYDDTVTELIGPPA